MNTYSPALQEHNADEYDTASRYVPAADEFVTPVDLASRVTSFGTDAVALAVRTDRVIGTASVASGEQAATTWRALSPVATTPVRPSVR